MSKLKTRVRSSQEIRNKYNTSPVSPSSEAEQRVPNCNTSAASLRASCVVMPRLSPASITDRDKRTSTNEDKLQIAKLTTEYLTGQENLLRQTEASGSESRRVEDNPRSESRRLEDNPRSESRRLEGGSESVKNLSDTLTDNLSLDQTEVIGVCVCDN